MYQFSKTRCIAAVILIVFAAGCGGGGGEEAADTPDGSANLDTAGTDAPPTGPERIAASHILIAHVDATRAAPEVTRTREEAEEYAGKVLDRAKKGEDFAALAGECSDGPTKVRGGFLGSFARGRMIKAFEDAAFALEVGAISHVVETDFGFHIIRREVLDEVTAAHILVAYEGAMRSQQTRTKDEALSRANEALEKARGDADFAELAKEYSDGPSGPRGGLLGTFGRGQMVPEFDAAVFELEVGQISDLVETQFGYHIIKRMP